MPVSVEQLKSHFKAMAEGKLPPNSLQVVRQRGSGKTKLFYKIHPQLQNLSPVKLAVDQAKNKIKSNPINTGKGSVAKKDKGSKTGRKQTSKRGRKVNQKTKDHLS